MVTTVRLNRGVLFAFLCLFPAQALAADDDDDLVVTAKPSPSSPPPPPAPAPTPVSPPPAAAPASPAKLWGLLPTLESIGRHLAFTGFAQADLHLSQASENEVQQGGALMNENRVLIRAARPRLDVDYTYAKLQLELDGNTVRGPELRLFHAFGVQRQLI